MAKSGRHAGERTIGRVTDGEIRAFAAGFGGEILRPEDEGYEEVRRVWNGMIDRRPAVVARATGTADVVTAVNFAREHGLEIAVHGGGHNVSGNAVSDGGLMLDLSRMNGVHVDRENRTVRVEGGATLGDVDRETQLFGLATPLGAVSETGVAGLTLNGGYGHISAGSSGSRRTTSSPSTSSRRTARSALRAPIGTRTCSGRSVAAATSAFTRRSAPREPIRTYHVLMTSSPPSSSRSTRSDPRCTSSSCGSTVTTPKR